MNNHKYVVEFDYNKYTEMENRYKNCIKIMDELYQQHPQKKLSDELREYYNSNYNSKVEGLFEEIINDFYKISESVQNAIYMYGMIYEEFHSKLNEFVVGQFSTEDGITDNEAFAQGSELAPNIFVDSSTKSPPPLMLVDGKPIEDCSGIIGKRGEVIVVDQILPPQYGDNPYIWRAVADGARKGGYNVEEGNFDYNWYDYVEAHCEVENASYPLIVEYEKYQSTEEAIEAAKKRGVYATRIRWTIKIPENAPLTSLGPESMQTEGIKLSTTIQFTTDSLIDIKTMGRIRLYIVDENKILPTKIIKPDQYYLITANEVLQKAKNKE